VEHWSLEQYSAPLGPGRCAAALVPGAGCRLQGRLLPLDAWLWRSPAGAGALRWVCLDRTLGDLPGQSSCLRPPCDRLQYCLVRQTLIPGDVWFRPWRKA